MPELSTFVKVFIASFGDIIDNKDVIWRKQKQSATKERSMGDIIYFQEKNKKDNTKSETPLFCGNIYIKEASCDSDYVDFLFQVALQLPFQSKLKFQKFFKEIKNLSQMVMMDGTPEMKHLMISMGFLVNMDNQSDESDK